jgi:hypothetical protein
VITGASGHRLHEQLIFAGLRLIGDRPERLGVQELTTRLRSPTTSRSRLRWPTG